MESPGGKKRTRKIGRAYNQAETLLQRDVESAQIRIMRELADESAGAGKNLQTLRRLVPAVVGRAMTPLVPSGTTPRVRAAFPRTAPMWVDGANPHE